MVKSRSKPVSISRRRRRNIGAYAQPFSGVGEEYEPLGSPSADTGFVLHETGYLANLHPWNFPNVYSPFWRIYFDFTPGHHVRFGDRQTPMGPDRVLVIPNHQRFDCVGESPVTKLWFAFSCTRNAEPSQRMPIIIPKNDTIAAFTEEFPPLFRSRKKDRRRQVFDLSLAFVMYILGRPKIRWQRPLPENIADIVAIINRSPAFSWTTPELARRAAMSSDGFSRSFRRWLHTTPARYVQQVRIREACRLLSDGEESIDRISSLMGFADRFHFSRVFKQLTNTTPARYRKLHNRPSS
ncbi:MAG: helix-turn-helix transcriptional regulator [Pirellulales bacterium]|nr:helix-turn-helix transcriptional regulator [Pirellulales bacterium]